MASKDPVSLQQKDLRKSALSKHVFLSLLFIGICLFGLLMVYSSSSPFSDKEFTHSHYFLIRHSVYMLLGFCGMFFFVYIFPYDKLRAYSIPIYGFSIILLLIEIGRASCRERVYAPV